MALPGHSSNAVRSPAGPVPLWRNVSFVLMWTSVAASGFGDRMINVGVLTLLGANREDVDGTSLQASIDFWFFLPYLLLGIPAGFLADRIPRKWIMLGCDEGRAAILAWTVLLVPATGSALLSEGDTPLVMGLVCAVGALAAVFNPARNATIPQIVPTSQIQSGNALIFGIAVIASLIGLGFGGWYFKTEDASTVRSGLVLGALFFAVSGTFFAFLRVQDRARSSIPRQPRALTAALRYITSHRRVAALIGINMLVWGAAMVVKSAAMGLCKTRYDTDPSQVISRFSAMNVALGVGMLAGAGWVAWMGTRRESAMIALATMLGAACAACGLALTPLYGVGLACAFGVGFFGNATIICVATLLQTLSPDHIRGRIMGVNTLTSTSTTVAVNFLIWRTPNADAMIVGALNVTALILAVVALGGLWRLMTRGPLDGRLVNALWHLTRAYGLVWHRLRWEGRHHVPAVGPAILAANHTTGLDPFMIQMAVHRTVRWVMDVSYMFSILGFFWRAIRPVGIDRPHNTVGATRDMIRRISAGEIIGIFPEGGVQRETRTLKPFHQGIALLATRTGAPVVPVWIEGTPAKRNMIWHFLWRGRVTVRFGRPYHPDPSGGHEAATEVLRHRMLQLGREREAT